MPGPSTLAAAAVIAIGGYEFTLPNVGVFDRVQLVHGVFLSNAAVMAYGAWFVWSGEAGRARRVLADNRLTNYVLLIASLGLVGIVSAGINQTSVLDVGQAGRLLLFALYAVLVVYWSRTRGQTFALRAYLIGMACGGLVNLCYSFAFPQLVVFGALPVLYGSNASGGTLSVAISLAALLWLMRETRSDARAAVAVTVIGASAAALSYSKTAMLIGALGVCSWFALMLPMLLRRSKAPVIVVAVTALAAILFVKPPGKDRSLIELLATAASVKFGNMTFEKRFGIDDYYITGSRFAYWPITWKILEDNPIAGVGYGGLYAAYNQARAGYENIALVELEDSRTTNPHNSFLYLVGANGFPGLVIVVWLFAKSLRLLFRCAASYGFEGRAVGLCLAGAYLCYGLTLPTLFNTEILYLPSAVAIACLSGISYSNPPTNDV